MKKHRVKLGLVEHNDPRDLYKPIKRHAKRPYYPMKVSAVSMMPLDYDSVLDEISKMVSCDYDILCNDGYFYSSYDSYEEE